MFGESVYNLIPKPAEEVVKPPMYRSKHDAAVPPSCSTIGLQGTTKLSSNNSGTAFVAGANKKEAGTFGKEAVGSIDPNSFLKKGASMQAKSANLHTTAAAMEGTRTLQKNTLSGYRPAVPRRNERPVMGLTTDKNFVVSNAVENILAVPKQPKAEAPPATDLPTFGKVPKYLQRIKNDIAEEKAYLQRMNNSRTNGEKDRLRPMSEDEKNELIAGLKRKWHETHKQYQTLTFSMDTVTKVQRKEGLEAEMEQIEKAIEKLSKKNIHVYDDSELW